MKRIHFFAALLFVVAACQTKPNGEKLVLDYLQENTNGTEYSIIEISAPDSLYSPFEVINSLMLTKSSSYADLSKQLTEAFDKSALKDRRAAALEVAKLADMEYNKRDDFNDIVNALTHPAYVDRPANRIAYTAKYKVDGDIQEDVFYLEKDGSAVGHTASELQERYLELCEINSQLFHLKMEAEDTARSMR
ncbi:MAG: hypothetical protein K5842_00060 [Bacteroidales bacterium]|nr:hypothetical protein [Bacteroidales bacterium]